MRHGGFFGPTVTLSHFTSWSKAIRPTGILAFLSMLRLDTSDVMRLRTYLRW